MKILLKYDQIGERTYQSKKDIIELLEDMAEIPREILLQFNAEENPFYKCARITRT